MGPSSQLKDPWRDSLDNLPALDPVSDSSESSPTGSTVRLQSADAICAHRREVAPTGSPHVGAHHNSYFGYPVLYDTPIPTLRHGRRRKRDLFRTLACLFWVRWRKHIGAVITAVAVIAICTNLRRLRLGFTTQGQTLRAKLSGTE